jgi:glyoxylase I family protein
MFPLYQFTLVTSVGIAFIQRRRIWTFITGESKDRDEIYGSFQGHNENPLIFDKAVNHESNQESTSLLSGVHHVTIIVEDLQKSKDFFINIFGMKDVSHLRHNPPFPGAFLQVGNQQMHLMELPNPDTDTIRPDYPARDKHIAFAVRDVDAAIKLLTDHQIPFKVSASGRRSIFFRDLDRNAFELIEA